MRSGDPDKVIFNYSSHVLTESEKAYFFKDLSLAVPPKAPEYADYLLLFELFYRDIHNLDVTNEKKEVLKARIKDCAFSLFNSYNENSPHLDLTPEEFAALKLLSKNKNLITKNRIKVTLLPLLTKAIISKLSDSNKFAQVPVAKDKQLNFIINVEKHIADRKDLKNSEVISKTIYKSLKPRDPRFGILYDLCKVYKQLVDNCPPFRSIISAIKTLTYSLVKFLVPLLEPITTNMYTVKSSFQFAKEIADQDP